jgi:CheY-like chemotaxis protein
LGQAMKNSVLLVDNLMTFKLLCLKIVTVTGIDSEIQSVANGLEALDVINKYLRGSASASDVIFVDLNMPVMDGLEFIRVFKSIDFYHKGKISIVILTPPLDSKNKERARKLGIDQFISQPVTDEQLRSILL